MPIADAHISRELSAAPGSNGAKDSFRDCAMRLQRSAYSAHWSHLQVYHLTSEASTDESTPISITKLSRTRICFRSGARMQRNLLVSYLKLILKGGTGTGIRKRISVSKSAKSVVIKDQKQRAHLQNIALI